MCFVQKTRDIYQITYYLIRIGIKSNIEARGRIAFLGRDTDETHNIMY